MSLEWDSLNHIRLILAIQKSFKIKFSAAETSNMKNVGDLAELISKKDRLSEHYLIYRARLVPRSARQFLSHP